ncbi:hypothetical protein C7271_12925, partial [filamentous cyanobacterium CCP5]
MVGHAREDVWDYPRPPRLERFDGRIRIVHAGVEIARDAHALRVLETSHPPTYYLPLDQLTAAGRAALVLGARPATVCEWKGRARYLDLRVEGAAPLPGVAWTYPSPTPAFAPLGGCVAFYAGPIDRCEIHGGRRGFKGGPGTWGWCAARKRRGPRRPSGRRGPRSGPSGRPGRRSAHEARVAVVGLERQRQDRRRVDATAVLTPRADRVPGAEQVLLALVLVLLLDDRGLELLLPVLPVRAAVLEQRVGRVVPVVVVDRALLLVPH